MRRVIQALGNGIRPHESMSALVIGLLGTGMSLLALLLQQCVSQATPCAAASIHRLRTSLSASGWY